MSWAGRVGGSMMRGHPRVARAAWSACGEALTCYSEIWLGRIFFIIIFILFLLSCRGIIGENVHYNSNNCCYYCNCYRCNSSHRQMLLIFLLLIFSITPITILFYHYYCVIMYCNSAFLTIFLSFILLLLLLLS